MSDIKPTSVLFVCLGNICRSPMAEGVFRAQVTKRGLTEQFIIDSAGMGAWHEGDLPDPRAIETMQRHGVDITYQRSRPIGQIDYLEFDLILGMDNQNMVDLNDRTPIDATANIHMFMDYCLSESVEIPDPYYGAGDGFEKVYKMLDKGCSALLEKTGSSSA